MSASRARKRSTPWPSGVANERGVALPLALMTLLVLAALVSALLGLGVAEPQIAANLVRASQALNLSEAGADRSVNLLRGGELAQDPNGPVRTATCSPCPGSTTTPWSNVLLANLGTYTVTTRPIGDMTIEVTSIGQTNGATATRTTRAVLTRQYDAGPYAILGDRVDLQGHAIVSGTMGSVQANSELSLTGSSNVAGAIDPLTGLQSGGTATTAANSCTGCTSPDHVANVALSGAAKTALDIGSLAPQDLAQHADYVLGKDFGGFILPVITIVSTGEVVLPGTGSMAAWSVSGKMVQGQLQWQFKCCSGSTPPANGTYYTASEIDITSNPGPWQATLIAGTTQGTGVIDMSGSPTITPAGNAHLLDLVIVAGNVSITGSPQLTGAMVGSNVDIKGDLGLTGNIIATGTVSVTGSAEITYGSKTRTPIVGPLRVVSWSNS